MKNLIIVLISVFAVSSLYCQQSSTQDKEKEAIIALIEEETQSYYDRDFERWSECYIHSDDNVRMLASKTWHNYLDGFEKHKNDIKSSFETEKETNREKKKPLTVKVYDKSAWIVFENEVFSEEGDSTEKVWVTYFLEKPENDWKIVYSNRIYSNSYYMAEWPRVNMIAYAKSIGKNPEDIGNFFYENAKTDWGSELGYDDFQNAVINEYTYLAPPEGMKILEQDDDHVIFTATGFATNLKKEGSLNNVSYAEYLAVGDTFWTKAGDFMGANFTQEITDKGVKVSVSKKK
jgi:hypothetical protein